MRPNSDDKNGDAFKGYEWKERLSGEVLPAVGHDGWGLRLFLLISPTGTARHYRSILANREPSGAVVALAATLCNEANWPDAAPELDDCARQVSRPQGWPWLSPTADPPLQRGKAIRKLPGFFGCSSPVPRWWPQFPLVAFHFSRTGAIAPSSIAIFSRRCCE